MSSPAIATAICSSASGLRLLDHPYYQAWQTGELQRQDLKGYAEQYRHFEACLPEVLSHTASQMRHGDARRLVEANLRDEMTNPRPHLEMFDDFGNAVGAVEQASPTKATSELVGLYKDASARGPIPLLAVVATYEVQAAEIAATKAGALSLHYGLDQLGSQFWTVHATVELQHSTWTVDALDALNSPTDKVTSWATRSAQAWWQFLDEREAIRAA